MGTKWDREESERVHPHVTSVEASETAGDRHHAIRYSNGARDDRAREAWRRRKRDRAREPDVELTADECEERPIDDPRADFLAIVSVGGVLHFTVDRDLAAAMSLAYHDRTQ